MANAHIICVALCLVCCTAAVAEPFLPQDDGQVLESLPVVGSGHDRDLRRARNALTKDPNNLQLAVALVKDYLTLGRTQADPRYFGYAQATLGPWWNNAKPPPQVLLLRATLRQNRHDFAAALRDLEQVLELQPRNAQAWLTRAVILAVLGDYAGARRNCLPLLHLTSHLVAISCLSNGSSLSGEAEKSYQLLEYALENAAQASIDERLWAATLLGEIATRLGDTEAAERHFLQAMNLGRPDAYLLSAYADLLLDQDRPQEVRNLLQDQTRSDGLLLRLALAEQRLGSPRLQHMVELLRVRFADNRRRGGTPHLRAEARFALELTDDAGQALHLAQRNWADQREPTDARLLLEAALATRQSQAARPVLEWLSRTTLQDVRLAALAEQIGRLNK